MSKRNLLNLILFVTIILLVVLVVYEPGKDKPITPTMLTTLNVDDVNEIKIIRHQAIKEEQNISFKRTDFGWQVVEPYNIAANTFRIKSILELLSSVSLSQNNMENLNPATFGLDKPSATIIFNNSAIVFGHNKSLKNNRYVKIDSTLHMIKDTFYYQLTAKTESYIAHKLLPEKSKIFKLNLPNLNIEKLPTGKWEVAPKTDSFSADAVNQLINEWQLSQAYDLVKIKAQPNIKPDITITLSNENIIRFKTVHNKENFGLFNIDSGIQYILSSDRKNKLLNLSGIEQND